MKDSVLLEKLVKLLVWLVSGLIVGIIGIFGYTYKVQQEINEKFAEKINKHEVMITRLEGKCDYYLMKK